MQRAVIGFIAFAANIVKLFQQPVELMKILQADDVLLDDLWGSICLCLCHSGTMAQMSSARNTEHLYLNTKSAITAPNTIGPDPFDLF